MITYTVVIPVYKRQAKAKRAVLSVCKQRLVDSKDVEIIICDDEKNKKQVTENRSLYERLSKQVVYRLNKYDEGPGGNRQTGLESAKGKFITFLDSDDVLNANFLYKMGKELTKSGVEIAVCLSGVTFEKGFSKFTKIKLLPLIFLKNMSFFFSYFFGKGRLNKSAFYLCQISHMMFSAQTVKGLKFNYDYRRGGEDWDFFVQAVRNRNIFIVWEKLVNFTYSSDSSTPQDLNQKLKWKSYMLLARRLPSSYKRGVFYYLFLMYIYLFGLTYEK